MTDTPGDESKLGEVDSAATPPPIPSRQTADPDRHLQDVLKAISRVNATSNPIRFRKQPTEQQRNQSIAAQDWTADIRHKRTLVVWTVVATSVQLLLTNLGIGYYLWFARADADRAVLLGWMSMTVLEVLGIMAIISDYLFPSNGSRRIVRPRRPRA